MILQARLSQLNSHQQCLDSYFQTESKLILNVHPLNRCVTETLSVGVKIKLWHIAYVVQNIQIFLFVVFRGTIIGTVLNDMVKVYNNLQIVWKKIIIPSQKVSLRTIGAPNMLQITQILSTNQKSLNFSPVVHMNKTQGENSHVDVI